MPAVKHFLEQVDSLLAEWEQAKSRLRTPTVRRPGLLAEAQWPAADNTMAPDASPSTGSRLPARLGPTQAEHFQMAALLRTLARRVLVLACLPRGTLSPRCTLFAHAAAEERYVYVPHPDAGHGLNSARYALAEHHDMDERVEELQALDPAGDEWGQKAGELAHKLCHHLKEEETKSFQDRQTGLHCLWQTCQTP